MPELPEVETLCRQLQKKIAGKKILATEIYDEKLSSVINLKNKTVCGVRRVGKTIEVILDDGYSVLIHLRMTGRLFWQEEAARPRHSRWRMSFAGGNVFLIDPRRFATIKVLPTTDQVAGSDIMQSFNQEAFIARHGRRKVKVKNLIMDQKAVVGIGNIYACETLHLAGVHPEKIAATLTIGDWEKIFLTAKSILKKAIRKRGTSISDWRDLNGRPGENQHELQAYGREGRKCIHCGGVIRRIKQGGRSTFYCSGCQK
jgi:formamidopyrimidine-DNA glycosylase